jgi:hypothetical protein
MWNMTEMFLTTHAHDTCADARHHGFHWGTTSRTEVDQFRYLCIWLIWSWSSNTHIAAAYRKGLGAYHSWQRVLMSSRLVPLQNPDHSLCHPPSP